MAAPKRFPDRVEIAAVRTEIEPLATGEESPEKCRLAGRVMARRELGKLVFLDLVDLAEESRRLRRLAFLRIQVEQSSDADRR